MTRISLSFSEAELLPDQARIRDLSAELLADTRFNTGEWMAPQADGAALRARLGATSLHDILLPPGQPLLPSAEERPEHMPILTPGVNASLTAVSFGTWGVYNQARRSVPKERRPEFEGREGVGLLDLSDSLLVTFDRGSDWRGHVHVGFWYEGLDGRKLGERLTVSTNHARPGEMPTVTSQVAVPGKDPEDGLRVYDRLHRPAADNEVALILDAVRELRATRGTP
jgi:hypothetical protein